MKKMFPGIVAGAMLFASCGDMYRDEIAALQNQIDAMKIRMDEINQDISSLSVIVKEVEEGGYVSSMEPTASGDGYVLVFNDGSSVTIRNGKDGKDGAAGKDGENGKDGADGQDGHTPVIGVRQDTDGLWYWTLDGNWLLDTSGAKVRASGTDGKDGADGKDGKNGEDGKDGTDGKTGPQGPAGTTPRLKIEDGRWLVSYDGGEHWADLGQAVGEKGETGDAMFQSVTQDNNNVILTLADGTVINIPKGSSLILTLDCDAEVEAAPASTLDIRYAVTSSLEDITLDVVSSADIHVDIEKTSSTAGILHVRTGYIIDAYSRVVVMVSNGMRNVMKTVRFSSTGQMMITDRSEFIVPSWGGDVTLAFQTDRDYEVVIPTGAKDWISLLPATKGMTAYTETLRVGANEGSLRTSRVTVRTWDRSASVYFNIIQEPRENEGVQGYTPGSIYVEEIGTTTATVYSSLSLVATLEPTSVGFCWSADRLQPTVEDHVVPAVFGQVFSAALTDLPELTTVYVRAYNDLGNTVHYSDPVSIRTRPMSGPILSAVEVGEIGLTTASVSASVLDDNGAPVTECGFVWADHIYPTTDDHLERVASKDHFNKVLAGLPRGTVLFVRAYATFRGGTVYSDQASFETHGAEYDVWDGSVAEAYAGGTGSSTDPFIIETAAQLALMARQVNVGTNADKSFRMAKNIDLNGRNWTPVGFGRSGTAGSCYFTGTFNGSHYDITGLYVEWAGNDAGLFGSCIGASLSNLSLSGVVRSEGDYVGGLCGYGINIQVSEVKCRVEVSGVDYVGGCLGVVLGKTGIRKCRNEGSVRGNQRVGGIAGSTGISSSSGPYLIDCSNVAEISGAQMVGGIAGYLDSNTNVTNCMNAGQISALSYHGGIVGYFKNSYSNNSYIRNCYNVGEITDSGTNGGILGFQENGYAFIYACHTLKGKLSSGNYHVCYYLSGSATSSASNTTSFTQTDQACLTTTSGSDVVDLLNSWVASNYNASNEYTRYRSWTYGQVDGKPCPVFKE